MNIALWIVASLLALGFLAGGSMKAFRPKEDLRKNMGWVDDFSPGMVKTIGVLEILAAIGLILPPALDIAPIFAPLAALGLVLMMIGAIVVHTRRKEHQSLAVNVVLLLLAAFVAWGRFGPYAF
ncbi:MAG: hypothetical protein QOE51_1992 [Actinoplanes sp.]|nr:hypothetical protein [Actinoplanes sp.]